MKLKKCIFLATLFLLLGGCDASKAPQIPVTKSQANVVPNSVVSGKSTSKPAVMNNMPSPLPTVIPMPLSTPTPQQRDPLAYPKSITSTLDLSKAWLLPDGQYFNLKHKTAIISTDFTDSNTFYLLAHLDTQTNSIAKVMFDGQGWKAKPLYETESIPHFIFTNAEELYAVGPQNSSTRHTIYKYDREGIRTVFAGSVKGFKDGPVSEALFNDPTGMGKDSKDNFYVLDRGNNRVRKISPDGIVSTVAGSGIAGAKDGPALQAEFRGMFNMEIDNKDNLFINGHGGTCIRKLTPSGIVTTHSGICGKAGYYDEKTPLYAAITDIVFNPHNNSLYLTDSETNSFGLNMLRRVWEDQFVTELHNNPASSCYAYPEDCFADGTGDEVLFNRPSGLSMAKSGKIFFVQDGNGIRKVVFE